MNERKRILGPVEWTALAVGLLILVYLAVKKGGFRPIERTVEVEFIDPAKSSHPAPADRSQSKSEQEVDRMLQEMAREFNGSENSSSSQALRNLNLSVEEKSFYQKIRENYRLDDRVQTANDWWKLLQYSHKTYSQIKALFEELSPNQQGSNNPEAVLANEAASKDLYSRLEDWYDLSADDIDAFVKKGKNSLEDWAVFLTKRGDRKK